MSTDNNNSITQSELALAREKIPAINTEGIAFVHEALQMLERNVNDFKAMKATFEALTNADVSAERIGAVLLRAEYDDFLSYVIKELKLRTTVFAGWFMAKTPLIMSHTALRLDREIVCMALQEFLVTDEIGLILINALRAEHAGQARFSVFSQGATMKALANQLLIAMHKQVKVYTPRVINAAQLLGYGTACSCGHDFAGAGFECEPAKDGDAPDRDLAVFIEYKKLHASDTIVQRPSDEAESETPPTIAARTKKRKTKK